MYNRRPLLMIIKEIENVFFAPSISLLPNLLATTIDPPTPKAKPGAWMIYKTGITKEVAAKASPEIKLPIKIPSNSEENCIAKIIKIDGIK